MTFFNMTRVADYIVDLYVLRDEIAAEKRDFWEQAWNECNARFWSCIDMLNAATGGDWEVQPSWNQVNETMHYRLYDKVTREWWTSREY